MTYNPVRITKKGHKQIVSPEGHLMMTYQKIPKDIKFKHPAVNDYNQDLCGGWFVHEHTPFEEVDRVALGLKPVGISSTRSLEEAKDKARELLKKGFLATYGKYSTHSQEFYFITASVTGKLKDYFDMTTLAEDYERYGLYPQIIKRYEDVNFARFHGGHYDIEDHPSEIVGLILGYPIENTISLMKMNGY